MVAAARWIDGCAVGVLAPAGAVTVRATLDGFFGLAGDLLGHAFGLAFGVLPRRLAALARARVSDADVCRASSVGGIGRLVRGVLRGGSRAERYRTFLPYLS